MTEEEITKLVNAQIASQFDKLLEKHLKANLKLGVFSPGWNNQVEVEIYYKGHRIHRDITEVRS